MTTRTLFIGLDGATFTVLDTLTGSDPRRGIVMPHLRRIMQQGARGFLRSTINPLTPPAWVSLMTGRSPGGHGVYDFLRAEERDEDVFFTLTDARDVQVETIWSVASRNHRSIVALNFPITAPPRPVNGFMVPGFVPWKHLRRNVTPPELFDRLRALPGFDAKELAWDFDREVQAMHELDRGGIEEWLSYHADREGQWFRIAEALLRDEEPDLMAVMFDGTDKIQHQAWRWLAPEYDWSNPAPGEEKIVALCRRYFAELDDFIGQLVAQAGPEAQVFFASDHGFTGSTEVVRMNQILHDMGYLGWRSHDGSVASERRAKSWFADLDWEKTLAYCPTPSSNGITIRVAARPGASGIPRDQYEEFRDAADARAPRVLRPRRRQGRAGGAQARGGVPRAGDGHGARPAVRLARLWLCIDRQPAAGHHTAVGGRRYPSPRRHIYRLRPGCLGRRSDRGCQDRGRGGDAAL